MPSVRSAGIATLAWYVLAGSSAGPATAPINPGWKVHGAPSTDATNVAVPAANGLSVPRVPQVVEKVPYRTCRMVCERVERQVPYQVCKMVAEECVRKVPVQTCRSRYPVRALNDNIAHMIVPLLKVMPGSMMRSL